MTTAQNDMTAVPEKTTASLQFLADAPELLKVRIHPAEFARLLGVSKQTVSQWIKKGHITINPLDGRLDVTTAVQQVLRNTDPGRLRARVLRQAVEDVQSLRLAAAQSDERVAEVQAQLETAAEEIRLSNAYAADVNCLLDNVFKLLRQREADFRASTDPDAWADLVYMLEFDAASRCGEAADELLPDDLPILHDIDMAAIYRELDALPDDLPDGIDEEPNHLARMLFADSGRGE
jgi:DNA-binding transcriptional regulator YdaS (Cro superfamily)